MTSNVSLVATSSPGLKLDKADSMAFLPTTETTSPQPVSVVIAQQFDQDVIGDLGNAVNTFIESGQVWALLIGFLLGYLLRGVTTYK